MHFENHCIYHIYNQGNNRRNIFLREAHYFYFIEKMRQHLLPFGDLLSWCLMPNHFHWQFYVKVTALPRHRVAKRPTDCNKLVTLNTSIGVLLRSYTRGINKELNWSGSLFRNETKAKGKLLDELITANHPHFLNTGSYDHICFDYIHQNPVKANLVREASRWRFSSAREYKWEMENGLCNRALARELGLGLRGNDSSEGE